MQKSLVAGFLALTLSTPAMALPLGAASMFNAYSRSQFNYGSTDIEGIIGASGDITYTGGDVGRHAGAAPYSIYAGGDVTIKSHYVKNGGIQAGGDIYLENTTVGGDLGAKGTTTMRAGSFDKPATLISEGTISVNNNGITGSAVTGGNFNGTSGSFKGNVSASDSINLNKYGITGTKTTGAPAPVVDIIDHQAISDAIVHAGSVFSTLATSASAVDSNVNPTVFEWLFRGDSGLNVFDISGDMLTSFSRIIFDGPADATFLVNVSGDYVDIRKPGGFSFLNGSSAGMVLFNLFEASVFDLRGSFWGTVLAPHAAVVTYGDGTLFGSLYANEITGVSQINSVYFTGAIDTPSLTRANAVPTPSALAMIALGLVALLRRLAGGGMRRVRVIAG